MSEEKEPEVKYNLTKEESKRAKSLWKRCLGLPHELQVDNKLTARMLSMKKD